MISFKDNKSLECLVLFGSHATNESDDLSDIDLLGVDNSSPRTVREQGKVNLSLYNFEELKEMSSQGNTFILHVLLEGICIFNADVFEEIKSHFKYKINYNEDIATAYYLAQLILVEKDNITNWAIANKRISWCVRTILISISVENRAPIFSKTKLARAGVKPTINYDESFSLVDAKSNKKRNDNILDVLTKFISYYKDYNEEIRMSKFSSGIVISTLESILNDQAFYE